MSRRCGLIVAMACGARAATAPVTAAAALLLMVRASTATPAPTPNVGCVTGIGTSYAGGATHTAAGAACINWEDGRSSDADTCGGTCNYCRNPDNDGGGIWCYTSTSYAWGYCSQVPDCSDTPANDATHPDSAYNSRTNTGTDTEHWLRGWRRVQPEPGPTYTGSAARTGAGVACVNWDAGQTGG